MRGRASDVYTQTSLIWSIPQASVRSIPSTRQYRSIRPLPFDLPLALYLLQQLDHVGSTTNDIQQYLGRRRRNRYRPDLYIDLQRFIEC